jgi:thioredoxin-dependent peroxiredoxin
VLVLGKVGASVATPANWRAGEDCIIVPAVSDQEAATMFLDGWVTVRP